MPEVNCPGCGGRWLDGLRYKHARDCDVRASLDTTHAADLDRLRRWGPFTRSATAAEQACAVAHGREDLAAVSGCDLDQLTAEVGPHPFGRSVTLTHPRRPPHNPDQPEETHP